MEHVGLLVRRPAYQVEHRDRDCADVRVDKFPTNHISFHQTRRSFYCILCHEIFKEIREQTRRFLPVVCIAREEGRLACLSNPFTCLQLFFDVQCEPYSEGNDDM